MYQLVLALLLCWLTLPVLAQQQLAKARQNSYLTKVFRLTTAQTQRLYLRGLAAARADFFTQPVDSFPTDAPVHRALPLGYYLVAHAEGPALVYWLRAETGRTVEVIDNQTDLSLAVRDSVGRLLPGAHVAVAGRPLAYDPATRTYRRAHGRATGLVAVTAAGRTTFHPLEQQSSAPGWWLRAGRRVLWGRPLGYLTAPLWGTVQGLRHPAYTSTGLVGLLRSPFNEAVRDQRRDHRETTRRNRWRGYLLVSQPRYRPSGDTLRLKARVLRAGSGRPSQRALTLWLSGAGLPRRKRLASLRPVRPGSYEYSLPLTDTLGLRPDTDAYLTLEDDRETTLAEGSFHFEDYELNNSRYALRMLEKAPRRGQPQAAFLRGTDASELSLLDAQVRLAVVPAAAPGPLAARRLFVPDTLWTHAQALDPVGETRVNLPAGIFPNVDFAYRVEATFLTADRERHVETARLPYRRDPGELRLALRRDSVLLSYDSLGLARPHRATLAIRKNRYAPDDSVYLLRQAVRLPLALPLHELAAAYELRDAAGRTASLLLGADNAALTLRSDRTSDSVRLAVDNPRRLPFWYYVYRGNRLRYRGYATAYALASKDPGAVAWHVSLHYAWGGAMQAAEYSVGPAPRQLLIAAEQPAVAYPGQRLRLAYRVTDEAGRPVPDADLTAYAYTSKFDQPSLPALPNYARPVPGRLARRRFRLLPGFTAYAPGRQPLAWRQWQHQLGLDSLQFYRFLYPENGAFYTYQPAPGGLTQVAAFVVDSGRVRAPIAVYVDGQPVYIHDVNQGQPYAAVADSGLHSLSIRTPSQLITLHEVYLRARHKLTLSLDPSQPCDGLTVESRPPTLDETELLTLRRTLLAVAGAVPATLRQGQVLRPLGPVYAGQYDGYRGAAYAGAPALAGPFRPDSILLRPLAGGRRKFLFEPLYEYRFSPGVVKLTCLAADRLGRLHGAGLPARLPLGDFAYTEADLRPRFAPAYRYPPVPDGPRATPTGQGRLELRRPPRPTTGPDDLPYPAYTLLTRPDQPGFRRLQPGLALLHALPPGRYRAAVLLADSTCLAPGELILVEANGQTYYQLTAADRQPAGPLSHFINQLVGRLAPPLAGPPAPPRHHAPRLEQPGPAQPGWRLLRGRVLDQASEEGLPGVTVLLKGTEIGVSTEADGSFELRVPATGEVLTFSFIGFVTQEREIGYGEPLEVRLAADTRQLSEAVVVGYGAQGRREVTGAVSVVSNELQGRVAGVSIQIRGSAAMAATQPLYIVNGLPFAGNLADINPADILDIKTLKGPAAAGIYGAQASAGVILITTRPGARLASQPGAAADQLPGQDPRLALRRHFRDYAWWRPTLVTDAQGRARTEVVLPDDVTSWDSFVVGSDAHGRLGTATGRVRAFKTLLAELAGPRFLLAGDRAQVLGKALNYQPDTAQVTTTFRVAGQAVRSQAHRVGTSVIDTLTVTAPAAADSLTLAFGLAQPSGYADGEQRSLPVLPVGTREHVGTFALLTARDTTVQLPLDPRLGPVTVRVESDALPTLLSEIQHLQQYAYLCNEQAASRLLGLLLEQRIRQQQGTEFGGRKVVNFLIKKLLAGRAADASAWGTWATSAASPWATVHVVETLLAAAQAGYPVALDRPRLQAYLLHELDESLSAPTPTRRYYGYVGSPDDQIRLLQLLHELGARADYGTYLRRVEAAAPRRPPLDRYLALTALRQRLGLAIQLDTLRRYRQRTQLGGVFYADTLHQGAYFRYLLPDQVGATLLAYQILRTQGGHEPELARLRVYLLGLRGSGYWRSTYETAQILATIGPDLLAPGAGGAGARVQLGGSAGLPAGPVTQFPLALTLPAGAGALTLHKEGGLPVYATAYQTRWNPAPAAVAGAFTVATTLAGQAGSRVALAAGRPAELLVTVDAKAEARYVLLEVPIPAGCSYGEPAPASPGEVHREYLRHQAAIFLDRLPVGRHTFRVALQPRYRGSYTLNPARAELLYFPTKFGRAGSKRVVVR